MSLEANSSGVKKQMQEQIHQRVEVIKITAAGGSDPILIAAIEQIAQLIDDIYYYEKFTPK